MNTIDTINIVKAFKTVAKQEFGNQPFTRKQAEKLCRTTYQYMYYDWYKHENVCETHTCDPYFTITNNHCESLTLDTILSYIDVDHKEPVESGTRIELYGVKVSPKEFANLPCDIQVQCKTVTWESVIKRNYYTLQTSEKLDEKANDFIRRTVGTIERKREKVAELQAEISRYEKLIAEYC